MSVVLDNSRACALCEWSRVRARGVEPRLTGEPVVWLTSVRQVPRLHPLHRRPPPLMDSQEELVEEGGTMMVRKICYTYSGQRQPDNVDDIL